MPIANAPTDIPKARFYVSMTDDFMSGWGHAANATNRHVIPCATLKEAEAIQREADRRPEMKRVTISTNRPRSRPGVLYTYGDPKPWLDRA